MARGSCDGCGRTVTIAGGIANIWTFSGRTGNAMTLDLADGSSYLLCYPCIEALPDDPTSEDVEALEAYEPADEDEAEDD